MISKIIIPGFILKDIDINYKNGFLTIKGQKKAQVNNSKIHNHRPDSYSDNFKSVVRFPQGIEKKKIIKILKDGILKIRIPLPSNLEEQSKTS